jgi:hypothetical protein
VAPRGKLTVSLESVEKSRISLAPLEEKRTVFRREEYRESPASRGE